MGVHEVVGQRIAKARRRQGWHQHRLAAEIGRSESWVSQVERGVVRLDSIETAEKIATVLKVDLAHLIALDVRSPESFKGTVGASGTRCAGTPGSKASATQPVPEGSGSEVERRTFLSVGIGAVVTSGVTPAVARDRRGAADPTTVADMRTAARAYRRAYRSVPAQALLPLAQGQVHLVRTLQPETQPTSQRQELLNQMSEMAALAGIMAYMDAGDARTGSRYLDIAHQAAKSIDHPDLLALAMGTRAFLTAYSGDPDGGLDCALAAVDHAERGASPRMLAWVLAVCSEMHASVREERECRAALERSRQLVDGLVDDAEWAGIGWYDTAKAHAYEGGDFVRLGRYRDALPLLDAALAGLDPSMARHRCTAHVDRAEAYAAADDVDAAVSDGHAALNLLETTHHVNSLERLTKLHRRLRRRNTAATRSFAEHLIDTRSLLTAAGVPA